MSKEKYNIPTQKEIKSKKVQRINHTKKLDAIRKNEASPQEHLEHYGIWLLKQNLRYSEMLVLYLTAASILDILPKGSATTQTLLCKSFANLTNSKSKIYAGLNIYSASQDYPSAILWNTAQHTTISHQHGKIKINKIELPAMENKYGTTSQNKGYKKIFTPFVGDQRFASDISRLLSNNNDIETIERLMTSDVKLLQTDDTNIVLYHAIDGKNIKKLYLLKKFGWNLNRISVISGESPIHPFSVACLKGEPEVVETLLVLGIDIHCGTSPEKLSALRNLVAGFLEKKDKIKLLQILEILIAKGLDVNPQGKNKQMVEAILIYAKNVGWHELDEFLHTFYRNVFLLPVKNHLPPENNYYGIQLLIGFFTFVLGVILFLCNPLRVFTKLQTMLNRTLESTSEKINLQKMQKNQNVSSHKETTKKHHNNLDKNSYSNKEKTSEKEIIKRELDDIKNIITSINKRVNEHDELCHKAPYLGNKYPEKFLFSYENDLSNLQNSNIHIEAVDKIKNKLVIILNEVDQKLQSIKSNYEKYQLNMLKQLDVPHRKPNIQNNNSSLAKEATRKEKNPKSTLRKTLLTKELSKDKEKEKEKEKKYKKSNLEKTETSNNAINIQNNAPVKTPVLFDNKYIPKKEVQYKTKKDLASNELPKMQKSYNATTHDPSNIQYSVNHTLLKPPAKQKLFHKEIKPEIALQTAMESYLQLSAQLDDLKYQDFESEISLDIYKLALAYYIMRTFNALLEMCKGDETKSNYLIKHFGGLRNRIVKCTFAPEIDTNVLAVFCFEIKKGFEIIYKNYKQHENVHQEKLFIFCDKVYQSDFNINLEQAWNNYQAKECDYQSKIQNLIHHLQKINQILKIVSNISELRNHPDRTAAAKALMMDASQIYFDYLQNIHTESKEDNNDLNSFFNQLRKNRNAIAHNAENYYDIGEEEILKINFRIPKIISILEKTRNAIIVTSTLRRTIGS